MDSSLACKRIFTFSNSEECHEIFLMLKVIRISSEHLKSIVIVRGKTGAGGSVVG
jgi:hypothetical protein